MSSGKDMIGMYQKREIMLHYDRIAPIYEIQYSEEQNAKIKAALNGTNFKKGGFVLDVGCGTGLLFEKVGDSVELIVGLDISLNVLKEAKERAKKIQNAFIVCADADLMPFQTAVFDHIFAITLLQNVPDPLSTLYEIKRVSKTQSMIVITRLKKGYSKNKFKRLLNSARLKVITMNEAVKLRGYVAICRTA